MMNQCKPDLVSPRGIVLGYCEKEEKLQLASLRVDGDVVLGCEVAEFWNLHEMMGYLVEKPRPLGIGAHATLALSTGREGWRAADYWIVEAPFHRQSEYDEFPFYWGPFQGTDHSLSAIAMLCALRTRWPGLPATETNSRGCYFHVTRSTIWHPLEERIEIVGDWLGITLPAVMRDGALDAVMSAHAMWMGLRGKWPIDLHKLNRPGSQAFVGSCQDGVSREDHYHQPAMSFESLIFPAGPVSFYWPPDDRADAGKLCADKPEILIPPQNEGVCHGN